MQNFYLLSIWYFHYQSTYAFYGSMNDILSKRGESFRSLVSFTLLYDFQLCLFVLYCRYYETWEVRQIIVVAV